jgi:hypothetical protein
MIEYCSVHSCPSLKFDYFLKTSFLMIRDADNQMSSTDLGLFQFIIFLFYALLSLTYELVIFILILILFDSS